MKIEYMKNIINKIIRWVKDNGKYISIYTFIELVFIIFPFTLSVVEYINEHHVFKHIKNGVVKRDFIDRVFIKCSGMMSLDIIMLFIVALIICIIKFRYIYIERKVNFYHSLPITRKKLFVKNFIDGVLIFLISKIIMYLVFSIEMIYYGCFTFDVIKYFVSLFYVNMLSFISVYSIFIFISMIVGNVIMGIFCVFIFSVYFPFFGLLYSWNAHGSSDILYLIIGILEKFNIFYFQKILTISKLQILHLCHERYYIPENINYFEFSIISILTIAIFCFFSIKLYKIRQLDKTNENIVFNMAKKIIIVLLTVFFSAIFCVIQRVMNQTRIYNIVFGVVITLFVHSLFGMIINKNFNSFYKDIFGKVISVGLIQLIFYSFEYFTIF